MKSTNTGHLTRLAIRDAEIRLHGLPHQAVSEVGIDSQSSSTLVLFPGRGATPLTAEYLALLKRPLTLLVPDGNWNQTRHMMGRVPMLRQARPVRLESPTLGVRSLRHNVYSDRRSTFEAIAQTLGILEGEEIGCRLLEFFRRVLVCKHGSGPDAAPPGPVSASSEEVPTVPLRL